MHTLLTQGGSPDLRAYFVWGPFLQSDSEDTARAVTHKYQASSTVHFWTPTASLAQQLAQVLRLPYGRAAWDVYLLYKRGTLWETSVPAPAYWQQQLDVLQGAAFNPQALEAKIREFLRPR